MEDILALIVSHWPFITVTLAFAILMQTLKGTVYTKTNIVKYKKSKPWLGETLWWLRKTMAIQPAIAALIGIIPGIPASPGVDTIGAKCLYFLAAGIISTWAFAIIKGLAKRRGIELEFSSSEPPKA
jgi:hypothetical protein